MPGGNQLSFLRFKTNVSMFYPFAEQYKLLTDHIEKIAAE